VGRGGHAHAADEARGEVGEDVAKYVFRDENVVTLGTLNEVERLGIDVGALRGNIRMLSGDLVEDFAKEGVALEDVRFVNAGNLRRPIRASLPPPSKAERKLRDTPRAVTSGHQRIGRHLVFKEDAALPRGEQTFALLAQDDQVDVAGLLTRERTASPRIE